MYNTTKLNIFKHYAMKMHNTKYQWAIEFKDFLEQQSDIAKK